MIDKRITNRKNFQGGGADASTTSFSKSFDRQMGTNTASRANTAVDRRQREGQGQADRDNRRIELNRLARQSAAEKAPDVKPNPFQRGGGGIGQLLASLLGLAMGIPGLGLAFSKKGMNFINEKFRGTNPDGSIRTQAEYEQSMYDKRQQNRVAKLLEAKNRGFNQIGFGDFTAKTVDFTPNQQALLDNLIAQGYGPASLDAANPTFQNDLGNPNMDLSGIQTIQQLANPTINAFPGMGVAPQPRQQQFIEELAPNLVDPVQNQVGNIDDLMAFAPNSKRDRALKNLYSGYENLGIKDPQMIDLMQQDLLENKEKGTPLSLPQSAYTLVG
jgi:hypothetical protein